MEVSLWPVGQLLGMAVCFGMRKSHLQFLLFAQAPHVYGVVACSFGQAAAVGTDAHLEHALFGHVARRSWGVAE